MKYQIILSEIPSIISSDIKYGDYIIYNNLNRCVPVQYLGGDLTGHESKFITSFIDYNGFEKELGIYNIDGQLKRLNTYTVDDIKNVFLSGVQIGINKEICRQNNLTQKNFDSAYDNILIELNKIKMIDIECEIVDIDTILNIPKIKITKIK